MPIIKQFSLGLVVIVLICFILLFLCYILAVFTNIPGISYVRDMWIETAMSTMNHRWLATSFFPESKIENVLEKRVSESADILGVGSKSLANVSLGATFDFGLTGDSSYALSMYKARQELFPTNEQVGSEDTLGNEIVVFDKEQGIKVVKVKGTGYVGFLALITNPERVVLGHSKDIGTCGDYVADISMQYGGVLGINASGFVDPDGNGTGGSIVGRSISSIDNSSYGWDNFDRFASVGFTSEDVLVVGKLKDPSEYNIRDLAQFGPVLIANGEVIVTGSAGWGLQPRTIVGQRSDGVVAFLVVDGRQATYSVGIEIGEAAKILNSYGVINASACDGGASAIMCYNGETLSHPCTRNIKGRKVPNAFVVLPLVAESEVSLE